MGKRWKLRWVAGVSALMIMQAALAGAPPPVFSGSFTKSFSPTVIPLNGTATVTYTIVNSGPATVSGLAFTDSLLPGLEVDTSVLPYVGCGGAFTGVGGSITTSSGSVSPSGTCSYSATVRGVALGTHTGATPVLTSASHVGMPGAGAAVSLSVVSAAGIPTLSEWGLILLLLAMAGSALHAVRRSRLGK